MLSKRIYLIATLCIFLLGIVVGDAAPDSDIPATAYLLTSFRGDGDGLHLAWSKDGYHWTDLNCVFLKPVVGSGLLRDPHILLASNGVFHMVWTTGWKDQGIGYASSTNLMDWSEQRFLPVMKNVPGTRNCWAPETIFDPASGQYIITWSSDVAGRFPETVSPYRMNNRTYYVTTKDFVTSSEPQIFLNPGFDHIDTTIIQVKGNYIAVFKEGDRPAENRAGPLYFAVSHSPLGPYTVNPTPIIAERAEGPTLIDIMGKTLLYVDFYSAGHYGIYETTDWKTWKDVSAAATVVPGQRHGTVLAVPGEVVRNLIHAQKKVVAQVP